ncbi:hypothetical protein IU459_35190 [Nocardia amamiensis]|uniref:Uncharacterized protein n=1 Tax=Nocardia amamiensis TaxID=404578 RepID=A0ABS0D273_9NOCA|nr:hypothetical protein [Nocardia amamiensis]MBF6302741.1 hypothetical protein [Nocardia amamiensis]
MATDLGKLGIALGRDELSFDLTEIASLCTSINQTTRSADDYFSVPDPALQADWSITIGRIMRVSANCQNAMHPDKDRFLTAVTELAVTARTAVPLLERIGSEALPTPTG